MSSADYDALHGLPPLVEAKIRTRHPDHYVLVNEHDGTRWRLGADGHWTRDTSPIAHRLEGAACSCGGWEAKLGESIQRGFDQHLLETRS